MADGTQFLTLNTFLARIPGPLRQLWGANLLLCALLLAALALRLYGINWDDGHGFHPDERSFYMRAGDMLCLLTASTEQDGPHCSAAHLRSLLDGGHFEGIEPGLPNLATALSAEDSPLNPRWFPLGSVLIYVLVLIRSLLEPFTDWGVMELRFIGRALAALADVGSVWLLYIIGRRMYGRWTGVLAAAFGTFAVIHIQHAHFYRPEPFTVLASLAALWAMLRFIETGRTRDGVLLGALVGLAMAPKISVAPILVPLVLTFLWVAKDRAGRSWSEARPSDVARVVPVAMLSGAAALATFFITTPYALLDFANFVSDVREQAGMAGEAGRFPFTWQYAETPAFLYQIRQTAVWGLGLPLGLSAWVAAPVTAWFAWRGGIAQRADLLLLAWAVPGFVFLELFEVRFLRYVFPLAPFYLLMAARMFTAIVAWADARRRPPESGGDPLPDDAPFSEEWHATPPTVGDDLVFDEPLFGDDPFPDAPFSEEWHATPPTAGVPVSMAPLVPAPAALEPASGPQTRPGLRGVTDRFAFSVAIVLLVIVLLATAIYAVAFLGIYSRPHTAVAAAEWINDNVPSRSKIINGGSFWDERIPDLHRYDVWTFPAYHPDRDPTKIPDLIDKLVESDYIIFYSNRAYGSVARLPEQFPQSAPFFRLLFAGELGYRLERGFTSYPSLAGVHLRDDPYARAGLTEPPLTPNGNDGQPDGIVINLGYADENVIGYDHPQVLVFRKVELLKTSELRDRIFAAAKAESTESSSLMLSPPSRAAQQSGGTWPELFDDDGWANRAPWLAWLVVVELLCLAAFPFTWWLFRPLPDRGILFARVVGLLLVAWVAWWLVSAGVLQFSAGAVWLAVLIVAVPSVAVLWRQWREMLAWLREKWRLALTAEALFLLAFSAFALIRAANPDLWHPWRGGEKPMELAYFTAVARSSVMPPYDPWFSGGYLNYYYWGYFILSIPLRITGIPPTTAFNVAVPLLFALTATGAGSLVYNMVRLARRGGPQSPAAMTGASQSDDISPSPNRLAKWQVNRYVPGGAAIAALFAALMTAVMGNLDGVVQLAEMAQRRFQGMAAPLSNFDFWRSSRAIPVADEFEPSRLTPWLAVDNHVETAFHITEFPFFTFLFADLHAHMMTMPFALLALAVGFAILVGMRRASLRRPWAWAAVSVLAVAVGSLWTINSWEYPAYALLMAAFAAGAAWLMPGTLRTRLTVGAGLSLMAVAISYAAFQPFHAANDTFGTGIEPTLWRTPISNYLLIHALPLLAAGALLCATMPPALRPVWFRASRGVRISAFHQWMLVAVGFGVLVAGYFLAAGFVTAGCLMVLLTLTGWAIASSLVSADFAERGSDLMALAMLAVALAIGIGVEFIRVEGDIARMNTLFKYYLVAWALFAASGAYGFWRGWTAAQAGTGLRRQLRWMAAGLVALVMAASLVYPALATPVRIADRFNPIHLTLDGQAWMADAQYHPPDWCVEKPLEPITFESDYGAIRWLQENVQGSPAVLEAHGSQYCWNTRISQYTGLPTVLGWPWHQQQQRNNPEAVRQRAKDVATIYNTPSRHRAAELLDDYGVAYIIVGELERQYYGERGIAKFDLMVADGGLELAYSNDAARIYRVLDRQP